MSSTTGTFHFFPGRSCALRREHPGCEDPARFAADASQQRASPFKIACGNKFSCARLFPAF
jgi:hypothetical protein